MYGIPLKFLIGGGAILLLLIVLGLHIRADNKMREQIISLQVDLRISENNYASCENINRENAIAAAEQQASIEQFAMEKTAAIELNEAMAKKLITERQNSESEFAQLRRKLQQAMATDSCANAAVPPDALILLNNAFSQAGAGQNQDG